MSFSASIWARKQKLPTMPKMVLMMLADHHNGETEACFPSLEVLAEECGMSERSVIRQIEALEELKLISVVRKRHTGNQYTLLISDTQSFNKEPKVTESHPISDTQSFSKVTESHPNQEYINQEINLSLSSPLSEQKNLSTDPHIEPISEPELTHSQKIIMSVVKAQNNHEMTEHEMKVLVWVVQEKQDLFWIERLEKTPKRFNQYLAGSLGEQFREFEAKKIRAEFTRNNADGFNNNGTYANAGGNYAQPSNIVQLSNARRKLTPAERSAIACGYAIAN